MRHRDEFKLVIERPQQARAVARFAPTFHIGLGDLARLVADAQTHGRVDELAYAGRAALRSLECGVLVQKRVGCTRETYHEPLEAKLARENRASTAKPTSNFRAANFTYIGKIKDRNHRLAVGRVRLKPRGRIGLDFGGQR